MTDTPADGFERLVKSTEHVRDLGEVFAPAGTVQAMLDLLPSDMWRPHPSPTFLEPACGDGNFLVAILARKLDRITTTARGHELPGGDDDDAVVFHALEAVASIYAVDISVDNIIGGTPGHETGARTRMLNVLNDWRQRATPETPHRPQRRHADSPIGSSTATSKSATCSPPTLMRTPSGRDRLPLVDYTWNPDDLTVAVAETTLGAVMTAGSAATTGVMSLFDANEPLTVWTGPAYELRKAPIVAASASPVKHATGTRRR